jgi:hypothetical protein
VFYRLVLSAAIIFSLKIKAQESPVYKNIIYAEGLGNALGYSINYERLVYKGEDFQNYLRIGVCIGRNTDWQYLSSSPKKSNLEYITPIMFVYQKGARQFKFEAGIGIFADFGEPTRRLNLIGHTGNSPIDLGLTGSLGLRYIGKKIPVFFKIAYTPTYIFLFTDKNFVWIWGGVSVGYAFGKAKERRASSHTEIEELPTYPVEQDTNVTKNKNNAVVLPNKKTIYPAKPVNKETYSSESNKTYFSVLFNYPSTRTLKGYSVGMEYYHTLNKKIAFTSSFTAKYGLLDGFINIPGIYGTNQQPTVFAACLQPFHFLIGQKALKVETGLSLSFINEDVNRASSYNTLGYNTYRFIYNVYLGVRYNFKKIPWQAHLGYVPYIDPYRHRVYDAPLFHLAGYEFGVGYILHKSKAAKRREEIKKRNKENGDL